MRILAIHPLSLRFAGYPYISEKARGLAEHGVEMAVLAPIDSGQTMVDGNRPFFRHIPIEFENGWVARSVKREVMRFDPDILHVWTPRGMPSRVGLELMVATGAKLVVNYEDPEHHHFDTTNGAFKCADSLAFMDKPFVAPEDVEAFLIRLNWHWVFESFRDPYSSSFLHPLFFALLNQAAAGFTAVCRPWIEVLHQRFRKPTLLMPHAVDFAKTTGADEIERDIRAELGISQNAFILLRAGIIYAFVNDLDVMLAGFADFVARHPNSILLMCGHDYQHEHTLESIKRLGIGDQVRWLGFLDAKTYTALLAAADVALCPGYPDDYNRFRLAGKIVEYMISGKAMICYATGIGEDLVNGRDALLLDEYTPERVCEHMNRLAEDEGLRRAMGANARKLAEQWFDIKTLSGRLRDFYQLIAGPSGSGSETSLV